MVQNPDDSGHFSRKLYAINQKQGKWQKKGLT